MLLKRPCRGVTSLGQCSSVTNELDPLMMKVMVVMMMIIDEEELKAAGSFSYVLIHSDGGGLTRLLSLATRVETHNDE